MMNDGQHFVFISGKYRLKNTLCRDLFFALQLWNRFLFPSADTAINTLKWWYRRVAANYRAEGGKARLPKFSTKKTAYGHLVKVEDVISISIIEVLHTIEPETTLTE